MSKNKKNNKNKNRGKNNTVEARRRSAENRKNRRSANEQREDAPKSKYRIRKEISPDMRVIAARMDALKGAKEFDLLNFIFNQYRSAFKSGDSPRKVEEWLYGLQASSIMANNIWIPGSYGNVVSFESKTVSKVVSCFELTSLDKEYAA